jgi:two-component system, LytTR family, response regulator LytT
LNTLLSFILADDDPLHREAALAQLNLFSGLQCRAVCANALEVFEAMKGEKPDLLILDVEMPGMSGLELARNISNLPLLIFISSHARYAATAFEVDAVDYLVKPYEPGRLMRAIEKARSLVSFKAATGTQDSFGLQADESFFVKDKNTFIRIQFREVLYIESLGDFVTIYLESGKKQLALVSLKNIEQQLPAAHFLRISRSHIINRNRVTAVDTEAVSLDKIQLAIGKTYADAVVPAILGQSAIRRFL